MPQSCVPTERLSILPKDDNWNRRTCFHAAFVAVPRGLVSAQLVKASDVRVLTN
jgi:hypothetical protein